MLRYYKKFKGDDTPRVEISYDKALNTLLGTYRDNDMTRDMLTIPNNIECRYSWVYVEEEIKHRTMVLMSGLVNMLPEDIEYGEDGNHI